MKCSYKHNPKQTLNIPGQNLIINSIIMFFYTIVGPYNAENIVSLYALHMEREMNLDLSGLLISKSE